MADKEIIKEDGFTQEFVADELENVSGGDKLVKISNGREEVVRKKKAQKTVTTGSLSSQPDEIEEI